MATRWYLSSSGAAAVSPAFDAAWEDTATAARRSMSATKSSSAAANFDGGGAGAGAQDVLLVQFVSAPLAAQAISGTVKGQIRVSEGDAACNARAQLVARVVSGDGATVRGTLVSAQADALSSEWTTGVAMNRKFPLAAISPATATEVTAQDGDRLVIEVGALAGDNGQDVVRLVVQDDQASDLPENETSTTAANSWIEFSADITLQGAAAATAPPGALGFGLGVGT